MLTLKPWSVYKMDRGKALNTNYKGEILLSSKGTLDCKSAKAI